MNKNKWTTEKTCKLIELYHESPILWDAKNINHRNKFKTTDALKEIAITLNTDSSQINRKLKIYTRSIQEKGVSIKI